MDERRLMSAACLIPGDVIGTLEDDLPAATVYRVTPGPARDSWQVDATAWNLRQRLHMRAWTWDLVAVYL